MAQVGAPRGINFAYEQTQKALDDQFAWIDQLDTKAGVLLAADGVIAGLLFGPQSVLLLIRKWPRFL